MEVVFFRYRLAGTIFTPPSPLSPPPSGRLPATAVEVVFFRYRPAGTRRLGFKEFVEALAAVAYEAGMQFEDVMVVLGCRSGQPLTPEASAVSVCGRGALWAVTPP